MTKIDLDGIGKSDISYEEARALARSADAAERAKLAARPDMKPEILYFLTDDPSADVRRNLALNEATPRQADIVLARDKQDSIRQDLAAKIARLVPELDPSQQDRVYQATIETLEILARDEVTRVRQILAEALKDVAHAPAAVIRQLARDAEIAVAEPVLAFSPVLTDEDLLDIIASNPVDGAMGAIAKRDGVSEAVADAIVDTDEEGAIAILLGNHSVQIREETLDAIIDTAAEVGSWHLPLVERPKLPLRAALRLARYVAESLVQTLQKRGELDDDEISEIKLVVEQRIQEDTFDPDWESSSRAPGVGVVDVDDMRDDQDGARKNKPTTPLEVAQDRKEKGELDEEAIILAMSRGDVDLVIAGIAVMSDTPLTIIESAMDMGSPTAVLAVCWNAGLSAKTAEVVQSKIAGFDEDVVMAAKGNRYPLSEDDLRHEIAALLEMVSINVNDREPMDQV